ncbi:MAG: HAD family hydrolase [Clostridia bacterium]|nr:HAD family hydrolase [Clostridia bacterium]
MKQDVLLVFDLDGTLWDSAQAVAESWNEVFFKADPTLPALTEDDVHGVMGMTMKEISEVLQPALKGGRRETVFEECCRHEVEYLYSHPGRTYPALRETLEELHRAGYELAIVSNCQRGYVEAFLHGSGLGSLFADYEEWERTGLVKGENIRLVMERNGYRKAVYVGDTRKDQEAAELAGIPFIHAAYGFGKAADPDGILYSFRELPELLEKMENKKQD